MILGCQKKGTQIHYPQKIGEKKIVSIITGDSAKVKIDALHNLTVSTASNVIIYYDEKQRDVLYISKYHNQQKAHDQLSKMIFPVVK